MNEYADIAALRQTLGAFVTGVTVVTTIDNEECPRGMTANSFTSVSLSPPLILVCIGNHAASYGIFAETDKFAVNILAETQQEVSGLFASRALHKFDGVAWRTEKTGAPILEDTLGYLDCSVHDRVVAGDHLVLIGRVEKFNSSGGRPLGFFAGGYIRFNHEQDIAPSGSARISIGCLAEFGDKILLCRDADGTGWSLPYGGESASPRVGRESLKERCTTLGTPVDLSFIYSVFTDDDGKLCIVYRASPHDASASVPSTQNDAALFDADDIEWEAIASRPVRTMLKRYLSERANDRFGIYVECENGGQVGVLDSSPQSFKSYIENIPG